MTQYQLTLDRETVQRLFTGDCQLGRLVEAVLNQVLNAQVSEQPQAAPHERSEQRQGYRNGYKPRQLTTRVGALTLQVPQVRYGQFSTKLFARYQRSEQALVLTLMEMVVNGVSTRKVARITEELCGTSFAKSTVSNLCKSLDPLVTAWNERDLRGQRYPFVLVDALVVKVCESGRMRAVSALASRIWQRRSQRSTNASEERKPAVSAWRIERLEQAGYPGQDVGQGQSLRQRQGREFLQDSEAHLSHFMAAVYNTKRLHSSLGYLPPVEFEAAYFVSMDELTCPVVR